MFGPEPRFAPFSPSLLREEPSVNHLLENFVFFFAVIDPIGSVPVFIAVTAQHKDHEKARIAVRAVLVAAGILLFFIVAGQLLLDAIGVPLAAFQIAGGIVLFLFALTMIFGDSKPEDEIKQLRCGKETAVFPLAVPSIASPGAMLAAVILTDNDQMSIAQQAVTTAVMLSVLAIALALLLGAKFIHRLIGDSGASIVSRVMGLILSAVAATSVLEGVKEFFSL